MLAFLLGLLAWTLIEYFLHRFVFHINIRGRHTQHHRAPRDREFLLVNKLPALALSAVFYLVFRSAAFLGGIWAGFAYYEWVHYRIHFTSDGGPLLTRQRARHFHHHFNSARQCFGVTTGFWDHVFRSW